MIARSCSKAWRQLGEILKPVRGPAVILSDGDAVFQPRKVERSGLWRAVDDRVLIYIHNGASAREFRKIILSDAAMTNISAEGLLSHAVRSLRCNFDARSHKFAKPRSDRIVVEFRALKSPISGLDDRSWRQDHGIFFRCQTAPLKYSYMLGGMFSSCACAMCLLTVSEYWKRSAQMRQCHWSRAKMYGRHSGLFGSSLGLGIFKSCKMNRNRALAP